jgi:hypothetical protein
MKILALLPLVLASVPVDILSALDSKVIPNEWILTFPTQENIISSYGANVKDNLTMKYQHKLNKLGAVHVMEAFQRKHQDALLIKTDHDNVFSLIQDGAQVYPNKIHTTFAIQENAPWNLAVFPL